MVRILLPSDDCSVRIAGEQVAVWREGGTRDDFRLIHRAKDAIFLDDASFGFVLQENHVILAVNDDVVGIVGIVKHSKHCILRKTQLLRCQNPVNGKYSPLSFSPPAPSRRSFRLLCPNPKHARHGRCCRQWRRATKNHINSITADFSSRYFPNLDRKHSSNRSAACLNETYPVIAV